MISLSLWSENSAKLPLFCVQHGQRRVGCGDASMTGLSLWSENLAKLTLFCAPIAPKMIPTSLLPRASRKTTIAISVRSLGWVEILILIFGQYLDIYGTTVWYLGYLCYLCYHRYHRYHRYHKCHRCHRYHRYHWYLMDKVSNCQKFPIENRPAIDFTLYTQEFL